MTLKEKKLQQLLLKQNNFGYQIKLILHSESFQLSVEGLFFLLSEKAAVFYFDVLEKLRYHYSFMN